MFSGGKKWKEKKMVDRKVEKKDSYLTRQTREGGENWREKMD